MRIYLATWIEDGQGKGLTEGGSRKRLLSFFFFRQQKIDNRLFQEYVDTGLIQKLRRKKG